MPANVTSIESEHDLRNALAELGRRKRRIAEIESACAIEVAQRQKEAEDTAAKHFAREDALEHLIEDYCGARRAEVLPEGKKSRDLGAGTVGWRAGRVSVKCADDDAVVTALMEIGRDDLVRFRDPTPDKSALKRARSEVEGQVEGLSFERGEDRFYIKTV